MEYNFTKEIKLKGLKVTPPRLAILKVLIKIKKPETVQNIYKKIKNIDIVTLYRTINSFEKKGLLKRVDLHKDSVFYELNIEHHHHIVCNKCGRLEDFKVCDLNHSIKKIIVKSLNFKIIKDHNFELFGICNKCVEN